MLKGLKSKSLKEYQSLRESYESLRGLTLRGHCMNLISFSLMVRHDTLNRHHFNTFQ